MTEQKQPLDLITFFRNTDLFVWCQRQESGLKWPLSGPRNWVQNTAVKNSCQNKQRYVLHRTIDA